MCLSCSCAECKGLFVAILLLVCMVACLLLCLHLCAGMGVFIICLHSCMVPFCAVLMFYCSCALNSGLAGLVAPLFLPLLPLSVFGHIRPSKARTRKT